MYRRNGHSAQKQSVHAKFSQRDSCGKNLSTTTWALQKFGAVGTLLGGSDTNIFLFSCYVKKRRVTSIWDSSALKVIFEGNMRTDQTFWFAKTHTRTHFWYLETPDLFICADPEYGSHAAFSCVFNFQEDDFHFKTRISPENLQLQFVWSNLYFIRKRSDTDSGHQFFVSCCFYMFLLSMAILKEFSYENLSPCRNSFGCHNASWAFLAAASEMPLGSPWALVHVELGRTWELFCLSCGDVFPQKMWKKIG